MQAKRSISLFLLTLYVVATLGMALRPYQCRCVRRDLARRVEALWQGTTVKRCTCCNCTPRPATSEDSAQVTLSARCCDDAHDVAPSLYLLRADDLSDEGSQTARFAVAMLSAVTETLASPRPAATIDTPSLAPPLFAGYAASAALRAPPVLV